MGQLYNRKKFKHLRTKLRRNSTKSEDRLWRELRGEQLGYKFRRQYGIENFIVDFYCPKLNLVIEVDGISHDSEEAQIKDARREEYLRSRGIKVLRYTSSEVFKNIESVTNDIMENCGKPYV
ncbi:MAG: endonuclease domain-containing protein [Patescibacteria group bacterium]